MTAPDLTRATGSASGWSVRLSLFYGCFFLTAGVAMPWFPVYLDARGLTADQIGLLLAVGFWIKPLANPLGSRWADHTGERRRPVVILLACVGGAFALYSQAETFYLFLAIALLAQAFNSPVLPLADNLTMTATAERGIDYGRVRLWGSVTFIGAVYGAGWLLEGRDADVILWLIVGGFWLTAAVSAGLPDIRFPRPQFRRRNPFALLGKPLFLIFLLATGFNSAAHAVLYGFGSLHWKSVGLSEAEIGVLWAVGVVAEIVLFAVSRRVIERIGPLKLLLLGCSAGLVRWTLTAWTDDFVPLIALQVLHAFTFGAAHLGAMHFIQRVAPEGMSATAQGLFAAFGMGLFMGFGAIAAGQLYGVFGGQAYLAMTALSAASATAALILLRRWDGERLVL